MTLSDLARQYAMQASLHAMWARIFTSDMVESRKSIYAMWVKQHVKNAIDCAQRARGEGWPT